MCDSVRGEYLSDPSPLLGPPTVSKTRNCCATRASVAAATAGVATDGALRAAAVETVSLTAGGAAFFFVTTFFCIERLSANSLLNKHWA